LATFISCPSFSCFLFNAAFTVNNTVKSKSKSKPEWFYLPQQLSLPLKYNALGINAHLRNSIENELVDLDQLWFAEYLRPSQPKGVIASFFDSREENFNFFFRVVRRIETLHPEFLDSKPERVSAYKCR
jgi:hypothetical protein